MSAWLDPLFQALDEAPVRIEFFFRDDDAGWRDDRLLLLLDLFRRYSIPVDLAVIPAELTEELSGELRRRAEMTPQLLAFHQHGWSHVNHEVEGRKCEFGSSRPRDRQYLDLAMGRKKIEELLDCVTEIFTPPWNRCTEITAECLAELGFKVLSRDATAAPLNHAALAEIPVHVDWFCKRNGERLSYQNLSKQIAEMSAQRPNVGIMLHHAVMDEAELDHLAQLLALLSTHSKASCLQMKALARLP
jgi:peptidoglycan/xylan/chitin deacetylase (PgdA/CDA1 family)